MSIAKALTIAGSDSSGGAGIQADLKTFQDLGVYGMNALTTIVAMKPEGWHHQVFPQPVDTVETQLNTILSIGVDAMKTGMLGSVDVIELAANKIKAHNLTNSVVDPVLVCKGEDEVLHPETADALREVLVPVAKVATPNLFEASQLAQMEKITTIEQMKEAAGKIHERGTQYVVVKGGKQLEHDRAVDVVYDGKSFIVLETEKIDTTYNHGAGCTFAAAITAELAKGTDVHDAIRTAKAFVTAAIEHGVRLNEYVGAVRHGAYRTFGGQETKITERTI
ncbi:MULTISPECIES: pyridoxine/pyridoxal/pyridoxamine kinase [unclassified Geomicrobium]|uniref:pyridoxine/pyridoxal/pyridoxamine kinase n=1 Tax=unclassified Geomicrobium TaxID=2628951 RepID=UPI00045EDD9B|nr:MULTISPECIES: pyridoxine/pyridoxal/pyridoxamine kinase [unclassified Geomicrobium]GAK00932.1 hydroxymethylpyrimidine phosphate kinase ThiD [Geomicrobium sp. JCM 19055]GAK10169.1 hydroxymethylpyrimidine phosphate kinase ThiD [Geomicrobium sp. JCM 19038]